MKFIVLVFTYTCMAMHRQINCFTSNAGLILSSPTTKMKELIAKGLSEQLLNFYKEGFHPCTLHDDSSIFPSVVKACYSPKFLHVGLQLHSVAVKTGYHSDIVTENSLLAMYARCDNVNSAVQVFDSMPVRDTITWNSMINSYIQTGYGVAAIATFKKMWSSGFQLKPELIASILSVCGRMGDLRFGREIHAQLVCTGRSNESIYLSTALLDLYSKCYDLHSACQVFDSMDRNEVSWTAMIAGCTKNRCFTMALDFFRAIHVEGFKPNRVTLVAALPACAKLGALKQGKEIHGYACRHGFESESHIAAALMEMYYKCGGAIRYASLVFERLEERDVVMWTCMIGYYSQCGECTKAMELFQRMRMDGIIPNSRTLLAVITSYPMNHGQAVHGYIVKTGLDSDLFIGNSLIDMYANYGHLDISQQIFNQMPERDSVSWSALIRAYGLSGYGLEALRLFQEMQDKQIEPDEITFLAVLSACNHGGLIQEGQTLFGQLMQNDKIDTTIEHYACYIDLLGRYGNIDDAFKVISSMPMKPIPSIWSCLVAWCKTHGRLDMANILVDELIHLDPDNSANYTLLRMVYAETGDWYSAEQVEDVKGMRGLKKTYGYSRLELQRELS